MSTLPSAINDLSIAEKFELLDALWQDIEAHAPTLTDEQSAKLDRRMAAYEQDPSLQSRKRLCDGIPRSARSWELNSPTQSMTDTAATIFSSVTPYRAQQAQ